MMEVSGLLGVMKYRSLLFYKCRPHRLILLILIVGASFFSFRSESQGVEVDEESVKVLHMKVLDNIDPRTNRYTELGLEKATEIGADFVILELDTYGGSLKDADEIRTRILDFSVPVFSFINKDAASAGALISIACDSIYMARGSSIGAATVVSQSGEVAPDKYQSYMRGIMRSTAESNGRDVRIAEAMVDEDVEIEGISEKGKVLTFSTSEAMEHGFCEGIVEGLDEIMNFQGISDYTVIEYELSSIDQIVDWFLNPVISGILILVILGGIYFELQTPGVGFPIIAALIGGLLYFVPYYLNGFAENWEILLLALGCGLIFLEMFVIPGFGIFGITGILITISTLILFMIDNDGISFRFVDPKVIYEAVLAVGISLLLALILIGGAGYKLVSGKFQRRITLQDEHNTSEGYSSPFPGKSLLGMKGRTLTVLRPSGFVMIGNKKLNAWSRDQVIEKGVEIQVVEVDMNGVKVKETPPS